MALLDDIFGAYARDMGVEVDGTKGSEKRRAPEEAKEKRKSSKAMCGE